MKRTFIFSFFITSCVCLFSTSNQTIWNLNRLDNIGGFAVTKTGSPSLIYTTDGDTAIEFNPSITTDPSTGTGDRIQVAGNPLAGYTSFTIEMIVKPYTASSAITPRIFHICHPDSASNATRTMTLEMRYSSTNLWYGDFFIKSVNSSGLTNTSNTYSTDKWMHMAMTYSNGTLKGYINGILQGSQTGTYTGLPTAAQISLGGRMQGKYYFKGAIKKLIFTPQALDSSSFTYDGTSAGIKSVKATIDTYALNQNYPNPVSKQTTITYTIPRSEYVRLDLYNLMGEKVKTMVDATVDAGIHEVYFEKDNLPVGVYFYTMTTSSGYKQTKKMQIIY